MPTNWSNFAAKVRRSISSLLSDKPACVCTLSPPFQAAMQAVPTVLGATWGMTWTTLVLPRYGSDKMLAQQAACLRGVFEAASRCGLLTMMHVLSFADKRTRGF